MTTTQINITAKDSTAAAFASANKGLEGLSSGAAQAAVALAGIGLSFGGLAASIKSSIDAADQTLELSQKIGVAVEQIAGLELAFKQSGLGADQLQSSISKLSKNVASGSQAFDAMGIATRGADGNLKSTRQILAEVSDKFAGYEDGIAKTALAMEIFGKSGSDLIPFLNEGSESLAEFDALAEKLGLTLSKDTAKKADEFNDTLGIIDGTFDGLSRRVAAEMLPTLQGLADQFLNAANNGDNVTKIAGFLSTALKGLVSVGIGVAGTFQTIGTALGGVAAMWGAIINGEFSQAGEIVRNLKTDLSNNFASTIDAITEAWSDNGAAVAEATNATKERGKIQAPLIKSLDDEKNALEKRNKAQDEALRLEHEYVKLLEIERKQRVDLLKPFEASTKKAAEQLDAIKDEISALSSVKANQIDIKEAVERTTIARLKENLSAHQDPEIIKQINDEIEARKKIADLIPIQKKLEEETKNTTDQVSELWKQAGRNIQSSLANGIFNFFDDGLKGMVKSVASTVGRILSEFAALKLAQSIGLSSMFSMGTGAVAAAGSTGGTSLLSNVGSGAGIMSMLKGGMGGLSSGISGMMSGGGVGAFALPLLGGFALNSMSNAFAGDKTLGNGFTDFMQKIPILGAGWDILAGFFGREPYKFRQQSIQGTAGSGGFAGDINNVYRSQGGVFSGNKHKDQKEEFSKEQQAIFDTAITEFYKSAHGFAENLGFSTDLVDNFTKQVQIKSEKGKTVTEEAIAEMIAGIGDSLARNVLPNVDDFRNAGETTIQTLSRLSGEFSVLTDAAALLFDKSSGWAQDFVKQFGFADRSAFLEQAGGANAFAGMVSGFAQNFLTDDQRMKPVIESLLSERDKLGLSGINTRSQYTSAVQSGNLNSDQLLFLLQNQEAINQVFIYLDKFNAAVTDTASAVENAADVISTVALSIARDVNDTEQGQRLNNSISETAQAIAELESIASQLSSTVNDINPLTTDQARAIVSNGNPFDPNLQNALSVLSTSDNNNFGSKLDLQRSNALNIGAINSLQNSVASNISAKEAQKSQYEFEKQMLQIALQNAAAMFNTLTQSTKTAEILDRVTGGGGAVLVEII